MKEGYLMGEWTPGEKNVPIDRQLEGKLVKSMEAMSAIWRMQDPVTDDEFAVPVLILSFYTRDLTVSNIVLTMGGVSSLLADIAEHYVSVCGGVEATNGEMTDEGLQRMIEDVMNQDQGDE
jgi:hypothetical protein